MGVNYIYKYDEQLAFQQQMLAFLSRDPINKTIAKKSMRNTLMRWDSNRITIWFERGNNWRKLNVFGRFSLGIWGLCVLLGRFGRV